MSTSTPRFSDSLQPFQTRFGRRVARFHPSVGPELSSLWLANPDSLTKGQPKGATWRGPSSDGAWFIKRRKGWKGKRALQRSFQFGLKLEEEGLPVAVHMALINEHKTRTTWLITEYLPGSDLDVALRRLPNHDQLIAITAKLVSRLHLAGYRQRDLKAPNIRITKEGVAAFIDLEGIRRGASTRRREKDLGRLAASFMALETTASDQVAWQGLLEAYSAHQKAAGAPDVELSDLSMRTRALGHAKLLRHRQEGRISR